MKEYWLSDNRDEAERNVLYMVVGALKYSKEYGKPMTTDEILQYIKENLQKEEARLNKIFPNKAR